MKNINELKCLHDIQAPDELKQSTLAAVRSLRRAQQQDTPQHLAPAPRSRFGIAKRLLAGACAFGVILGGAAVWRTRGGEQPTGDVVASAIAHSFGFVAYAADTGELIEPRDSRIVFENGAGVDDPEKGFYSGCLFRVTGENIQSVSASMSKGALYRTKTIKGQGDEWVDAIHQRTAPEINGADQVMVSGLEDDEGNMQMFADLAWTLENGFTDTYDPDVSYGFWAAPGVGELGADADLREAWHHKVDMFNGAMLTVTVTFTDGVQQTKTLTLHTGKLAVEYPDDGSGPVYTGEVLTDAQAAERGYLYGVYAEIG